MSTLIDSAEAQLDKYLSASDLPSAIKLLNDDSTTINLTRDRFISIFAAIEDATSAPSENQLIADPDQIYPAVSPGRSTMTDAYSALKSRGHLLAFGAAGNGNVLAGGSKTVVPKLLEEILSMKMSSLTPQPSNTLLVAGAVLATAEAVLALVTGWDFSVLALLTVLLSLADRLLLNGAAFEFLQRLIMPSYAEKVRRHEAGHFLVAYLLGCPVEGCVLSPLAALKDVRFAGTVSAGTSFFDKELSLQVNGRKPLTRDSIDRFSVIVMAGIAAEAIHFGQADGGAGDEMALVRFLTQIMPRSGGARLWDGDTIKNQARWGVLQAVLLIKRYKPCYDALCDALERGGDLGECVYAIEKAVRDNNVVVHEQPLGVILDRGEYGVWLTDTEKEGDKQLTVPVDSQTPSAPALSMLKGEQNVKNELVDTLSEEEVLREYKAVMEKKLKDIDDKLGML
eukprot:CAMPEP_0172490662 /NCGR_PEP_ID=MMETSP1066-20121228/21178_1 /TAXON_ID=671091 /ORGANISM="Coscinodiscus wailesii, Strain CCMP2513" /LENGTH=452 /DNA_ID=CAMNT_0013259255 /DNA_START=433 /DNA_END=1791 /DNA_ORIENTATION=+